MKIDVITLHAVKNYGSVLQAFATKKLFEEYGHEVNIINYVKEESKEENLLRFWAGDNPIKKLVMLPTIKKWKKVFGGFCEEELGISKDRYTTANDFKKYQLKADLYCTGSDQVWNSKWNNGILPELYLSFVPKTEYKFAFAASFGQDRLTDEEVASTKPFIDQYRFISVREDSAKKIIEEQYKYTPCTHLVDPTLGLDKNVWRKYAIKSNDHEKYILIYNLNRSTAFDNFAKEISRRTGLKLKRLCMRYDQVFRCGKSVIIPEVFEFISLIDNAEFVLTDSFHATAFSMNMNTQPICVYPNEFGGRIDSFLRMTNSLQCHVTDFNDFSVVDRKVDFEKVNLILEKKRRQMHDFLEKVFLDYREKAREK